jgi:hypothetical protein
MKNKKNEFGIKPIAILSILFAINFSSTVPLAVDKEAVGGARKLAYQENKNQQDSSIWGIDPIFYSYFEYKGVFSFLDNDPIPHNELLEEDKSATVNSIYSDLSSHDKKNKTEKETKVIAARVWGLENGGDSRINHSQAMCDPETDPKKSAKTPHSWKIIENKGNKNDEKKSRNEYYSHENQYLPQKIKDIINRDIVNPISEKEMKKNVTKNYIGNKYLYSNILYILRSECFRHIIHKTIFTDARIENFEELKTICKKFVANKFKNNSIYKFINK